jgi:hypothetical protein
VYRGAISHDDIIRAFQRHVPGCYVRDYRDNGGFITICKNYRDIKWTDQSTTSKVERQVPATTLVNLPRGYVTAPTQFKGFKLHRPGWRLQFRNAMKYLSHNQMRRITRELRAGEVFPGIL